MTRAEHNARVCEGLAAPFRAKVEQWLTDCDKVMLGIWVVCGMRTDAEQFALFRQGRVQKPDGTWVVQDPKKVVTNARSAQNGPHPRGAAIDFCPMIEGKLAWQREDLFKSAAALAKRRNIAWGGDWKSEHSKALGDLDHLEDPAWRSFKIPEGVK